MSMNPAVEQLDLKWSFGDRIRKLRRATGLNQTEFGDRIGQKPGTISAWESGRNDEPRGVVAISKRIELAYGVSALWVLGMQESPYPKGQGPDGNLSAHSEGLEPPTFWSGVNGKLIPGPWNLEAVAA